MTAKRLLRETILLSLGAVWMRALGLFCSAWLTRRLGTQTLGLTQLVWTAFGFAGTLCSAGIRLAATQLITRAGARGHSGGRILRFCVLWGLASGSLAAAVLWGEASLIAKALLQDARLAPALQNAAAGLPFLAVSAALYGCYTARGRLLQLTALQGAEQLASIGLTLLFIRQAADPYQAAAALAAAGPATEAFSCALAVCFLPRGESGPSAPLRLRPFLRIVLPSAASSSVTAGLHAVQEISIPAMLMLWGLTQPEAMSAYGAVGGVVYPILFFPAAVLTSLSVAIVPELTAAHTRGDRVRLRRLCETVLRGTLLFSAVCCLFVREYADELTLVCFGDAGNGRLLALFSPLILLAYLDLVTDSMLRSIDRPLHATASGAADAASSLLLVRLLVPRCGLVGLVAAVLLAKLLNLTMSLFWLTDALALRLSPVRDLFFPLFQAAAAAALSRRLPAGDGAAALLLHALVYLSLCAAPTALFCARKRKAARNSAGAAA